MVHYSVLALQVFNNVVCLIIDSKKLERVLCILIQLYLFNGTCIFLFLFEICLSILILLLSLPGTLIHLCNTQ